MVFSVLITGTAHATTGGLTATPNPPSISNTTIDVGQYSLLSASVSGGNPPYKGYYIVHSVAAGGCHLGCSVISGGITPISKEPVQLLIHPTSSSDMSFIQSNFSTGNTVTLNDLNVSDSIGIWKFDLYACDTYYSNKTTCSGFPNSVTTGNATLTVNTAPTITASPGNIALDAGQTETYTITVNGGTGPFDVTLVNYTCYPCSGVVGTNTISTPGGSATISFTTKGTGNFAYYGDVKDMGTTTPYETTTGTSNIVVNATPSFSPPIAAPSAVDITNSISHAGKTTTLVGTEFTVYGCVVPVSVTTTL